jgi:hypothetical protein
LMIMQVDLKGPVVLTILNPLRPLVLQKSCIDPGLFAPQDIAALGNL